MSRRQRVGLERRPLLIGLLAGVLVFGCGQKAGSPPKPGTGGAGGPGVDVSALRLHITDVLVDGTPIGKNHTFLAPSAQVLVRAKVTGSGGFDQHIRWTVEPANPSTGPAVLVSAQEGPQVSFRATSMEGRGGRRDPNPPLEYKVRASLVVGGSVVKAELPAKNALRQAEAEVLRQEYSDYKTRFQPAIDDVTAPRRQSFNTGNYSVIAEGRKNGLEELLDGVSQRAVALLNNDVQEVPVGQGGLAADAVVVSPGPPTPHVGALGDTDPENDDVCAGPLVKGVCAGPILAGPNGIAESHANNRQVTLDVEKLITSAFRNPQRNTAAGSKALNSLHTVGLALDLDPRGADVKGKTTDQLMCVLEQAGALTVGNQGKSFTEQGATTFLDCNHPQADHVHVNFNLQ